MLSVLGVLEMCVLFRGRIRSIRVSINFLGVLIRSALVHELTPPVRVIYSPHFNKIFSFVVLPNNAFKYAHIEHELKNKLDNSSQSDAWLIIQ